MSPRVRRVVAPFVTVCAVVALSACGGEDGPDDGVPDRPADVHGEVAEDAVFGGGPALTQASDDYYEGMALLTEDTVVLDAGGTAADAEILDPGVTVEVWVGDACAESYPVQCGVEVVRVDP